MKKKIILLLASLALALPSLIWAASCTINFVPAKGTGGWTWKSTYITNITYYPGPNAESSQKVKGIAPNVCVPGGTGGLTKIVPLGTLEGIDCSSGQIVVSGVEYFGTCDAAANSIPNFWWRSQCFKGMTDVPGTVGNVAKGTYEAQSSQQAYVPCS